MYFSLGVSHDSQIEFSPPNKTEIIILKCYKDKKRFIITVISPFLVNVSLGRYLLLLDFGINGEVTEGLSAASRSMGIGNDVGGLFTQTLIHTLLGCPGKWQPGVGK